MAPQLKRRGVKIETEIEYRVGPFFVLAVNILSIDFTKLCKYSHRLVAKRKKEWAEDQERRDELQKDLAQEDAAKEASTSAHHRLFGWIRRVSNLTRLEFIAQFLAWMHYLHWIIHIPLCWIVYYFFCRTSMRKYILSTVADGTFFLYCAGDEKWNLNESMNETCNNTKHLTHDFIIFRTEVFAYVEEKGMEMEIGIIEPYRQAAFMLSALREIREGTKKSKKNETGEGGESEIVGPLLGPAIKSDKGPAPPACDVPENLEFVNFEADLPVGFKRLRWAMLATESAFNKDAIFPEAKLEK